MRPVVTLLRTVVALPLAFTLAGCCPDDVRLVSVEPSFYNWVGDTIPVMATAFAEPRLLCLGVVYTSETDPMQFWYTSSDTAVASLGVRGGQVILTARAPGWTWLVAVSENVASDSMPVVVSPAIASLRVTFTPATGQVGDTITVQLDALDSLGAAITNALVWPLALIPQSDTLATWLTPHSPYGPAWYTPVVDRFVAQHAGVVRVVAAAPHSVGWVERGIADTVTLSILAR